MYLWPRSHAHRIGVSANPRAVQCNECHPFFIGKQKLVDTGGRVERRYGARKGQAKKS